MATITGTGPRLPIAPGAYRDILFLEVAEPDLPRSAWAPGPDRHLSCTFDTFTFRGSGTRTYKFIPQCTAPPDPKALYYLAWDTERKRNVYAIGPQWLDAFALDVGRYFTAAEAIYGVSNGVSIHEVNTVRMLQLVQAGDIAGIVRQLGKSWLDALQDPLWWLQTATTVAAIGGGSRVTVQRAPVASEAEALARTAGEEAAARGYGYVKIGGYMEPDSINAQLMVNESEVRYIVSGIRATDAVTNAVKAPSQSVAKIAHREMLVQAALNARNNGLSQFTLRGEQVCDNFINHANRLSAAAGAPGTMKLIGSGNYRHLEVKMQVDRVLTLNNVIEEKIERALWGPAFNQAVTTAGQGDANAPQPQ